MGYSIALFLHVCGALGLFAAIGIELVGVVGLRRAGTVDQVRTYGRVIKVTEPMFPLAAVTLLGAGIYMTVTEWSFRTPFVAVGLTTLVVMAVTGSTVQGRRWQRVEKAAQDAEAGPVPESLRRLIDDPVAWSSMGGAISAAVGVVALMTIKPGWTVSIAIATLTYVVGSMVGLLLVRRRVESTRVSVAG